VTSEATPAIQTFGLYRRFGRHDAVVDLNLRVPRGTVYGLIGPNGAGKTTTLRMLAGLTQPSSGRIQLLGRLSGEDPRQLRRLVGYMPDSFGVYESMRCWEYLDFYGRCHRIPPARRDRLVSELLDLVDLSAKRDADVGDLSRGMKQRLCLAQALVHDPQILLLDEPASGLDPRARLDMRELLRELRQLGKTIVVSSHILSELEDLCDAVGVMESGRLLASGDLSQLAEQVHPERVLELQLLGAASLSRTLDFLRRRPGLRILEDSGREVDGDGADAADRVPLDLAGLPASDAPWIAFALDGGDEAQAALLAQLMAAGLPVLAFRPRQRDLERMFLSITRGS